VDCKPQIVDKPLPEICPRICCKTGDHDTASTADWRLAVERDAVIRPLAEEATSPGTANGLSGKLLQDERILYGL